VRPTEFAGPTLSGLGVPGDVIEDGAALLDDVTAFLRAFVAFPTPAAASAVALWAAFTHVHEAAETSPRLALLSAEKRSGKSRCLEVLELIVCRPIFTASMSAAALFRVVEAERPTVLMDEVDTIFAKGVDPRAEELRGLLNAGQRRGTKAVRCCGPRMDQVRRYDVFAPVALAGIGDLPDTVADRSILIRMKRRAPGEVVKRFRRRDVAVNGGALRERLEAWAEADLEALADARPAVPDSLDDRAADGWETLIAIADAAGGDWPARARAAAVELSATREPDDETLGVRLLGDVRTVLAGADRMSSADLVAGLVELPEAPWGSWYGRTLSQRDLARLLRRYDIRPRLLRIGAAVFRGYEAADSHDAWSRYLPPTVSAPIHPLHRYSAAQSAELPLQPEAPNSPETASDLRRSGVTDEEALQAPPAGSVGTDHHSEWSSPGATSLADGGPGPGANGQLPLLATETAGPPEPTPARPRSSASSLPPPGERRPGPPRGTWAPGWSCAPRAGPSSWAPCATCGTPTPDLADNGFPWCGEAECPPPTAGHSPARGRP